jgi:hypothetical protein
MTTQLISLVLTASIWMFIVLGAGSQFFVNSHTVLGMLR